MNLDSNSAADLFEAQGEWGSVTLRFPQTEDLAGNSHSGQLRVAHVPPSCTSSVKTETRLKIKAATTSFLPGSEVPAAGKQ